MKKRVFITGMGVVSCIGKNKAENLVSLRQGRSGIGIDPERKKHHFKSSLTGVVCFDGLSEPLPRRVRNAIPYHGLYAIEAIREAIADAGLVPADVGGRHDTGLITGNDTCLEAVIEGWENYRGEVDTKYLGSQTTIRGMNSALSLNIGPYFGIEGFTLTISAACASGSQAAGIGTMLIRQGMQKRMIVGGAQEVNWYAMSCFDAMRAISQNERNPPAACRPFEKNRDGLVPSGGAAFLIIEDEKTARDRGAKIYGEITGYGFSGDGEHPVLPNGRGAKSAMAMALEDAGLRPGQIDYINAHATATVEGDKAEAWAINQLFGDGGPYLSSTKSMTGHECWMAGASEMVYSSLMMNEGFLAPNINYDEPDPGLPPLNIVTSAIEAEPEHIMSNSFGFGGTNSTLILSRVRDL